MEVDSLVRVPIRIRYGRKSSSRSNTFTMVFSNVSSVGHGSAIVIPFNEKLKSFRSLEKQALAMSRAEGIWRNGESTLNCPWGAVGLLINPSLESSGGLKVIKERWRNIYSKYEFDNSMFNLEGETELISEDGFLNLEWTQEMSAFDFILATITQPNPRRLIDVSEIAEAINQSKYDQYFLKNIENGIRTFQDSLILEKLTTKDASNLKKSI